jgi:ketosteroid isomerase-like protein
MTDVEALAAILKANPVFLVRSGSTARGRPTYRNDWEDLAARLIAAGVTLREGDASTERKKR